MQWKLYWRNVVARYRVIIKGWPEGIRFKNLSDATSSLQDLEVLLRKWKAGKIFWRKLTDEEFNTMDADRNKDIENGKIDDPGRRRRRSDFGKKRTQQANAHQSSDQADHSGSSDEDTSRVKKKRQSKRRQPISDSEGDEAGQHNEEVVLSEGV